MKRGHKVTLETGKALAADMRKRRFAYAPPRMHHNRTFTNSETITFKIDSVRDANPSVPAEAPYTGLKIATVTVQGASLGAVSLIDDQVDVVDHSECLLNLTESELLDLFGWATERIYKSLDETAPEGTLTPLHWDMDDTCCPGGA